MGKKRLINEYVRKKLQKLRQEKRLSAAEVAHRLGVPRTSYVSMETGAYNLKLDHVYRILAVLDADIMDVWPQPGERTELEVSRSHHLAIQRFRLNEVLSLSNSEGGVLLARYGSKVSVVMSSGLSDYFVDRLAYYLQDGELYKPGGWFRLNGGVSGYYLYLRPETVPKHVHAVIEHYLTIWACFFDSAVLRKASNDR